MRRLGRQGEVTEILPLRQMLPAPGQGALAVEVRRSDSLLRRLVQKIDHPPTRWAVVGERTFAAAMGGDCNLPLAALGKVTSGRLNLHGAVYSENGARCLQGRLEGPSTSAVRIAQRLAGELRRKGAEKLLHDVTPAGSST
jgi:hydroxymethylbilane synthase